MNIYIKLTFLNEKDPFKLIFGFGCSAVGRWGMLSNVSTAIIKGKVQDHHCIYIL